MIITRTPFRISFAGGGSDLASYYEKYGGSVVSVSINKYRSLEKCLKQYFEKEKIDCEYKCEKCNQVSKVSANIF